MLNISRNDKKEITPLPHDLPCVALAKPEAGRFYLRPGLFSLTPVPKPPVEAQDSMNFIALGL